MSADVDFSQPHPVALFLLSLFRYVSFVYVLVFFHFQWLFRKVEKETDDNRNTVQRVHCTCLSPHHVFYRCIFYFLGTKKRMTEKETHFYPSAIYMIMHLLV